VLRFNLVKKEAARAAGRPGEGRTASGDGKKGEVGRIREPERERKE